MRSFLGWAHSLVYVVRGTHALREKDYDGVIEHYSRAIELSPEDLDYYYKRGDAYVQKEEYGRAVADYTKIIELNPDAFAAFLHRGLINLHRGFLPQAINDLTHVIESGAEMNVAHLLRAECYYAANEREKALADLEKGMLGAPLSPWVLDLKKRCELDEVPDEARPSGKAG